MAAHLQTRRVLDYVSELTLGQVFWALYNSPTRLNLTIAAVIIVCRVPAIYAKWIDWRISRKVVHFDYPVPLEASRSWIGKVIEGPNLFSHLDDDTLLPRTHSVGDAKTEYIACYDPSTAFHLQTIPLPTSTEIKERINNTHAAQPVWAKTSFAERKRVLRSIKAWVFRDMQGIVDVACRDTGKTKVDAVFGEILTTLAKVDWLLNYGEKVLQPSRRPGNLLVAHKITTVHHIPLGTTLSLVSWNYSFHNLISPILASLFAGNTAIVKCSEQVAWSSMWFMGGIQACLRACGFSGEEVGLVICLPELAGEVTRNKLFGHITFIGSEPVGKKVAIAAAESMIPTCIELGGKDPALLLPGTNLERIASTLLRGVYQSAGQNCIGIELVLVHRSQYDQLISLLLPRIQALRCGIDLGSLISSTPLPQLMSILSNSISSGAKILHGGKPHIDVKNPYASYFEPTLIVDVTLDMEVARKELFAPVMSVVTYDDVNEAVRGLNAGRFGLGAGVYGEDKAECKRVADLLNVGMVSINDFGVFYLNQAAPFGGVKASGHGRFGGEEGLLSLTSAKTIIEDRFFSLIRTSIPRPVDFPLPEERIYWGFLQGLVRLGHDGLIGRIGGLVGLVKACLA